MKILFLDIDGVLNNDVTVERITGRGALYNGYLGINPYLRDIYLTWLKKYPDVAIVLSSSWRQHEPMKEELKSQGIYWIDQTPSLGLRSSEVERWLFAADHRGYGITHYAILDDFELFEGEQIDHFIKTNPKIGVTESDLAKVAKILELG